MAVMRRPSPRVSLLLLFILLLCLSAVPPPSVPPSMHACLLIRPKSSLPSLPPSFHLYSTFGSHVRYPWPSIRYTSSTRLVCTWFSSPPPQADRPSTSPLYVLTRAEPSHPASHTHPTSASILPPHDPHPIIYFLPQTFMLAVSLQGHAHCYCCLFLHLLLLPLPLPSSGCCLLLFLPLSSCGAALTAPPPSSPPLPSSPPPASPPLGDGASACNGSVRLAEPLPQAT